MFNIAYAASQAGTVAQGFLAKINQAILFPLITLMMAVALVVFLYGAFEYVRDSGSEAGREKGRQHLIYGVIGMLVMLSAFAILSIAAATFGLSVDQSGSGERNPFSPPGSDIPPSISPPGSDIPPSYSP